jgi:tetratricopeptide (TPR) repeat protein
MSGTWWQIRQVLIVACVATIPLLVWRDTGAIAQTRRDRLAEAAYARGVAAQMDGRYDAAAAEFRDALALSPRATGAYTALGDVEFRRGRTDDAIAAYRQLMAIYPFTYIAELYRQVGLFELRGDQPEAAVRDLRQAVTLDPEDWVAFYWLGHASARVGDYASARASWSRVLLLNPDYPPAVRQLRDLNAKHP